MSSFCALVLLASALPLSARKVAQNKQLARTQFEKAERLREELNGRPAGERTRRDYQQVTDAYRRVYYLAPTSSKADSAVVAVAELLAESGRRFSESKTLQAAVGQYEFLRREYPGSKYRVDALFTVAQIYKSDLNDLPQAKATFQEFLKHYPHSHLVDEAKAALAELEQPPEKKKKETESREPVAAAPAKTPRSLVTGIRYWSTPDYTRVAIDVEAEVQYQAGRVPNPDRIFFDLHETKLASTLIGKSFDVQDGFLKKIRVAQYLKGITRVVLEVDDLSDYSAFLLPNPYRLIIDIHGRQSRATKLATTKDGAKDKDKADKATEARATIPPSPSTASEVARPASDAKAQPAAPASAAREVKRESAPNLADNKPSPLPTKVADGTTAPLKPELDEVARASARAAERLGAPESSQRVRERRASAAGDSKPEPAAPETRRGGASTGEARKTQVQGADQPAERTPVASRTSSARRPTEAAPSRSNTDLPSVRPTGAKPSSSAAGSKPAASSSAEKPKLIQDEDPADTVTVARLDPPDLAKSKPTSSPTFESVAPRATLPAPSRTKSGPTDLNKGKRHTSTEVAIHEARPTASGERSLIRALGLKIGRIVVDAGHGGHDTGTIGPNGLQEKDLVLDVALRLGKLLESKLGADVIYTRDDDTFIPLETRTAIANQNQADLFISIHANSSADASARGVETYYLNFTSSADALEVAARENAVSEKSIHELQDLVKKIALKEKVEESREFAADVQRSLWSGVALKNPTVRNRGVKKAPFVVLIGANMPSILAEISFLSNPTDERRLQTPDYRQKIAEYLYRGIVRYVNGLSGVNVAQKRSPAR